MRRQSIAEGQKARLWWAESAAPKIQIHLTPLAECNVGVAASGAMR